MAAELSTLGFTDSKSSKRLSQPIAGPRPAILCLIGHYLPGYRAGGPVRSVANLVELLGDEYDFRIITTNRDFGADSCYKDIRAGVWMRVGKALVHYLDTASGFPARLSEVVRITPHDLRYYSSFFQPRFSILPLLLTRLGQLPPRPSILAPRGEFAEAALRIKRYRKHLYLTACRGLSLTQGAFWHATSQHEAEDIRKAMGQAVGIHVAPNLPSISEVIPSHVARSVGEPLRVVFLSRVSRMKNLSFALEVLMQVSTPVRFSIVGTFEDMAYWRECQAQIGGLPDHIEIRVENGIAPGEVSRELAEHDVLLLPTQGENYGHVIVESLAAGTPVLISDRTRWRQLESAGVGWDFPLDNPTLYANVIDALASQASAAVASQRKTCVEYARRIASETGVVESYRCMFAKALVGAV